MRDKREILGKFSHGRQRSEVGSGVGNGSPGVGVLGCGSKPCGVCI